MTELQKDTPMGLGAVGTELDVAIPLPVRDPFTYRAPVGSENALAREGTRIRVPFKNREITGYVVAVRRGAAHGRKLKPAISFLDQAPVLDAPLLELARRVSLFYRSSWGEAISCALPGAASRLRTLDVDSALSDCGFGELGADAGRRLELSTEQARAVSRIQEALAARTAHGFLLQGVTGSGKTEVYLRAIEKTLSMGRRALCLVPEIVLTIELASYLRKTLGDTLEVLHSGLTDSERRKRWMRIRSGAARVVLGARSAVFAPLSNVGLIVVDEEQETSFKQEDAPRYRATTVATWRAQLEHSVLLLGSATPSLESYEAARQGRLERLELSRRVENRSLPEVLVVDLRAERRSTRSPKLISRVLADRLSRTVSRGEAAVLFLNRRGFATSVHCLVCGECLSCPTCRLSLTYHAAGELALCHYCNFRVLRPSRCFSCGNTHLELAGAGTQRLEAEVRALLPSARVARLDTDVARKRGASEKILSAFKRGESDILIGTQMVAKGLDVERVTLVGVALADTTLAQPDFRAAERTFQLLVQVSGRSGRGNRKGEVIIQTYSPEHDAIRYAIRGEVEAFYDRELRRRRELRLPPLTSLARLEVSSAEERRAQEGAQALLAHLSDSLPSCISLVGPAPMPLYRLRGAYRWQVLLKAEGPEALVSFLAHRVSCFRKPPGTRLLEDVDPINFM